MVLGYLISGSTNSGCIPDFLKTLQGFLVAKEVEECSPRTTEFYKDRLTRFAAFLKSKGHGLELPDFCRQDIDVFMLDMQNRGCTPGTRNSSYRALKAFFRWCIAEDLIKQSPLRNIKQAQVPKKGKPFLPDTGLKTILTLCVPTLFVGARNAAIVTVFWTTGMRLAECADLQLSDVSWEGNFIRIRKGKGAKERCVPLMPAAKKALWRYLRHRTDNLSALWLTEERAALSRPGFKTNIHRIMDRSGFGDLPDGCHIFRRTWAMRQLKSGVLINSVRIIGGWESVKTLEGYVRAMTSEGASTEKRVQNASARVLEQYVRAMESEDAMSAKWA